MIHRGRVRLLLGPAADINRPNSGRAGQTPGPWRGDGFNVGDYQSMKQSPQQEGGAIFASALTERMGEQACCIPAFDIELEQPTTIGLGDTFVGGYLAAMRHGQD